MSPIRLLIVDDNATNRQILSMQAQSWGMVPTETDSGVDALDLIRRGEAFDVAILDMQMPDMDGLTLATEIRRYRDHRVLPLVMLTPALFEMPTIASELFPVVIAVAEAIVTAPPARA